MAALDIPHWGIYRAEISSWPWPLIKEKWQWIEWNFTWNPKPLLVPMGISGTQAHISPTSRVYFHEFWCILQARCNCLLNVFVMEIHHQMFPCGIIVDAIKFVLFTKIFLCNYSSSNMLKRTSINTVTKQQNYLEIDMNLIFAKRLYWT